MWYILKLVYRNGSECCLGEARDCCYEGEVERVENDPWCSFETGKHSDDKKRAKQRKCVFNDMLKVQRKQNLQLYLFETVKYTKFTDLAVNTMIRVNKNLMQNKMLFTCQACH